MFILTGIDDDKSKLEDSELMICECLLLQEQAEMLMSNKALYSEAVSQTVVNIIKKIWTWIKKIWNFLVPVINGIFGTHFGNNNSGYGGSSSSSDRQYYPLSSDVRGTQIDNAMGSLLTLLTRVAKDVESTKKAVNSVTGNASSLDDNALLMIADATPNTEMSKMLFLNMKGTQDRINNQLAYDVLRIMNADREKNPISLYLKYATELTMQVSDIMTEAHLNSDNPDIKESMLGKMHMLMNQFWHRYEATIGKIEQYPLVTASKPKNIFKIIHDLLRSLGREKHDMAIFAPSANLGDMMSTISELCGAVNSYATILSETTVDNKKIEEERKKINSILVDKIYGMGGAYTSIDDLIKSLPSSPAEIRAVLFKNTFTKISPTEGVLTDGIITGLITGHNVRSSMPVEYMQQSLVTKYKKGLHDKTTLNKLTVDVEKISQNTELLSKYKELGVLLQYTTSLLNTLVSVHMRNLELVAVFGTFAFYSAIYEIFNWCAFKSPLAKGKAT